MRCVLDARSTHALSSWTHALSSLLDARPMHALRRAFDACAKCICECVRVCVSVCVCVCVRESVCDCAFDALSSTQALSSKAGKVKQALVALLQS